MRIGSSSGGSLDTFGPKTPNGTKVFVMPGNQPVLAS
jgi:hypothetical protein